MVSLVLPEQRERSLCPLSGSLSKHRLPRSELNLAKALTALLVRTSQSVAETAVLGHDSVSPRNSCLTGQTVFFSC